MPCKKKQKQNSKIRQRPHTHGEDNSVASKLPSQKI